MKINRPLSLAVVGALAAGVLPLVVATAAQAAPTPVVVTGGDVSVDGSSGWAVETRNGGTGSFVNGTGTPPLGSGSWFMKSNAVGDKKFLHLTKVDGVPLLGRPLTDLTGLSFSTFAADATFSPYVNIPIHSAAIDADRNGIADGAEGFAGAASGNAILVYEPVVASSTWAESDTIGTPALWRMTRPVISGGSIPAFTYKTWDTWLGIFTDGIINPLYGDIQWVIGDTSSVSWSGKSGWVDAITVTTTTETATYDLEEGLGSCPVAIDTPAKTLTLTGDCTTDSTLTLHDGWTLDGAGHTITAIDPAPGVDFTGPVLTNEVVPGGARIDVTDVHIDGNLDSGCSSSLFGVRFDGAGGSFTHSTISDIKYGTGSGCQSGNSLDITNLGGPTRLSVTVDDVQVTGFQKTGVRANGNVALRLTGSRVADAELDLVTASNSLQISRGARAYVSGNTLGGNDWDGNDQWNATGVLLYGAQDVTFTRNVVSGTDTDVALYVASDPSYPAGRTTLTCNLFERDAAIDTPFDLWNTGVAADEDLLAIVDATGNTVRGFATPYENVVNETGGPCASGPVLDLAIDGSTSSVTASWTAPGAQDFAPVSAYEVTLVPGGATQTVLGTTATFSGLSPAKEYTVTVVPVNAAGPGTPAAATGTTGPGAATITEAGTTNTSVSLGWSVPGNAYTGFDLVIEDVDGVVATATVDGDARTWTFSGLDPETDYTLTVTPLIGTTNGTPDSVDVTTDASTAPPTAPGPVTGLALTGAGTSLTASWTASPGATDYEATLLPGGQVLTVTSTSAVFTIVPGKELTVTVVPHSGGGYGPGRSASIDTALPVAPAGFSVSASTTSAALAWTPPAPASPVTGYTVTATPLVGAPVTVALPAAGLTYPVKVNGLARNTTYTFAVRATNAFGTGPASAKKMTGAVTTAKVTPTKVTYGQKITVKGKVTSADTGKPLSGQTLYLYAKTKGSTSYVSLGAKASSAADGSYTLAYRPTSSRSYYVSSRGPSAMGASSHAASVALKGKATLSLSDASVTKGTKVVFSGKVRPGSGSVAQLQRKEASGWVTKKSVTPSSGGSYAFSWKPSSTRDYTWRVRVSGPTFSAGVSARKLLTVT